MTVQIKPSKPKEEHNGLVAIEADILKAQKGEEITAIVTYVRAKRIEDEKTEDYYPVLEVKHIEPILGDDVEKAKALQLAAYSKRTGENELDFSSVTDDEGDDK